MSSYVSRLILAGCLMVPCLLFGQVTIECIVNETVTAGECNDCTNITDSVFVKFGLRCINGSDTTILEGPVRIKARGSSGDVVMFDYRANPPQGSTQSFFFNVSAAAQFGDIQDVFAYVRDCASFLVDYGDSTNRVHWGDTLLIRYPEATIAPGDTTYYWIIMANGADPDTITMSEVVNFVQSGEVTITKGPTNLVIHVPDMRDSFNLYALPDSSNRLILARNGIPQDTVDFFGIGLFNDSYADSAGVWSNDTVMVYRRDTSGIIDSFPIVIPASSINTDDQQVTNFNFNTGSRVLTLEIEDDGQAPHTVVIPDSIGTDDQQLSIVTDGLTDTIFLEDGGFVVLHDSVGINTDDQQLSQSTDGLIDTIFLENGGFVVLHDSVGVGQPDTYLDSVRHITDGLIDSIWFYRDSTGVLVDSFLVVLHDSTGTNTNDTYLSATWCSGDTLFAERSDTSGIIDTLIVAGIPCSRDTCEILIEPITYPSAFGYEHVTGLRYTYCGSVDSVCFVNSIKYVPYYHGEDTLYFLTEEIVDCDSATYDIYPIYIDPGNDIRVDTTWFVDDTLYQQRVDTSGIIDTIITEILTKDFDFIRLDGDTMVTLVDTLIPRDSADLHKLIWHGGRVRLGLPAYEHSIYLDTTTGNYLNFVLHQDSVDTGLQIFGRRSAIDIYHHTRPYQHFRNQFGEFWQRIFDPTAEGPLEPQRWEFGAVGKYDNDTTSRPIFTIDNDADAFSLNITPGYLQSDIYASDRSIDTANIHGIFAADSSGRFVLMQVDSVGDINIINPNDSDWLRIPDYGIPANDEDKFTFGRVRIGQDSIEHASATVLINGGVAPLITKGSTTANLFRQATRSNNQRWDYLVQAGHLRILHGDDDASTQGNYLFFEGGYTGTTFDVMSLKNNGDVGLGLYPNSRDDGEISDSILSIYYPNANGDILTASIDSLAAALQLTGIISGSDSLGTAFPATELIHGDATIAGTSSPNLTYSAGLLNVLGSGNIGYNAVSSAADAFMFLENPTNRWGLRTSGSTLIYRDVTNSKNIMGITANAPDNSLSILGTGQMLMSAYTSTASFPGTAVGLIGFDASGNLLTQTFASAGDQLGTAFTAGRLVFGDGTTAGTSSSRLRFESDIFKVGFNHTALTGMSPVATLVADSNAIRTLHLENLSTGTASEMRFVAAAGTDYLAFTTPAASNTGTLFGMSRSAAHFIFAAKSGGTATRSLVIGNNNDVAGAHLIFGTRAVERMRLTSAGDLTINTLAGTGTRMVTASSAGVLGTATIPSGDLLGTAFTSGQIIVGNGATSGTSFSTLRYTSDILRVGGTHNAIGAHTPIQTLVGNDNSIMALQLENQSTGTSSEMRFVARSSGDGTYLAFTAPGSSTTGTLFGVTRGAGHFMFNTGTSKTLGIGTNGSSTLLFGTNNLPRMTISNAGSVAISDLGGTGTRMVTATSTGVLGTAAITSGTVTSVAAGNGLNFTTITGSGSVTLGTPSSVTLASTNSVSSTSHTHAFAPGGTTAQYIRGDGSLATDNFTVRASSGTSKTSSTTLSDANGLSLTVQSGQTYEFEARLYTTSNPASGVKVAIGGTATATGGVMQESYIIDGNAIVGQTRSTTRGATLSAVTAVTAGHIIISGSIVVNSGGTLTVQFAQNVSGGISSVIFAGSTFKIIPIS